MTPTDFTKDFTTDFTADFMLEFKRALGRFLTGVTVITALDSEGNPVGVTVNAFSSVSLDPPMILVCLDKTTARLPHYLEGKAFAVNILSEPQTDLSNGFASPDDGTFCNAAYDTWETGVPILQGCVANLECTSVKVLDGGDHVIILGSVRATAVFDDRTPLAYFGSQYGKLARTPATQS